MQNSLRIFTAERAKKTLAVTLAYFVLGNVVKADTAPLNAFNLPTGTWTVVNPGQNNSTVIAGDPIVMNPITLPNLPQETGSGSTVVMGGPIVMGTSLLMTLGPPIPTQTSPLSYPAGPLPSFAVKDEAPEGLTIRLASPGSLRAPRGTMFLPDNVGKYDAALGAQMGCSVSTMTVNGRPSGEYISCPLVAKGSILSASFTSSNGSSTVSNSCFVRKAVPDNSGIDIYFPRIIANSICPLTSENYSTYKYQCGLGQVRNADGSYTAALACRPATLRFPIQLRSSDNNKSGKVLKSPLSIELQDADRKVTNSFVTTYAEATAVTNPEKIGWLKLPKEPEESSSKKFCDPQPGLVNMCVLFSDGHESKGMELAKTIMVAAAVLVVGAFAGPILSGAAGEFLANTTATRFLVMVPEMVNTPVYAPFL